MASIKPRWGIFSFQVGFPNAGGFIETSIGYPRLKLHAISRRMNCNIEGKRFDVRKAPYLPHSKDTHYGN